MHGLPSSYTTELTIVGCRVTRVESPGSFEGRYALLVADGTTHRVDWDGRGTFEVTRLDETPPYGNGERCVGLRGVVTGLWAAAFDGDMDHWLVCELDTQYGIVFGSFAVCGPPHFVLDIDVRPLDVFRKTSHSSMKATRYASTPDQSGCFVQRSEYDPFVIKRYYRGF